MDVEEQYLDVLQNIEFAIVKVHSEQPALVDFDVETALNALINYYQAQSGGSSGRPIRLNERSQAVYEAVKMMCEWRLGNETLISADKHQRPLSLVPVSLDVIIACLKRIRKSVQRWNREGGRQGYLTFIARFIR